MTVAGEVGRTKQSTFDWSQQDCILYGLAVGAGLTPPELKFVYEAGLVPLPTFSSVAARESGLKASDLDVDYGKVVHKSQTTRFHAPLAASGSLAVQSRVARVRDQGTARGAEILIETVLSDPLAGSPTASIETVLQARGDGTPAGQPAGAEDSALPRRHADLMVPLQVPLNSALLYRLCGDRNPIHVDPERAADAGFPRPLLHGLCLYGMVCHALLKECCAFEESRLVQLHVAFKAPVFPGDSLQLDVWMDGDYLSHQVRAPERGARVASGWATLRAGGIPRSLEATV